MRLIRTFAALVCLSSVAMADQKAPIETLADWYAQGSAPKFSEIQGSWAGRCFTTKDQIIANGGILFAYTQEDNGPGLGATDRFWMWSYSSDAPNAYDEPKNPATTEAIGYWHSNRLSFKAFLTKDNTLASTVHKQPYWLSLRKHGNYLVVKTHAMKTERYCYFFKQLKFD